MATVASLVSNPVFMRNPRPKLNAAKLSASRHASVSFSSSSPKLNVDVKLASFFSAAENNRYYPTITTDSVVSGRHASTCKTPNATKDRLGAPVGRIGGKWPWELMLQVSFSGKGRDARFDLNQIAERAASTYKGLSYILNDTIVALLRHNEYYSLSSLSVIKNGESLVNVNNKKVQRPTSRNSKYNDDIMVTLFVGAKGELDLLTIYEQYYDLENVLQELRSIGSSNNITAVDVSWTAHVSSV